MPLKSGRLTPMELSFVESMARHRDSTYAAYRAGYAFPQIVGDRMRRHPVIKEAIRQETQRYLFEEAGALAVSTLAEVCGDRKYAASTRVKSATVLAQLSNIGISDEIAGKPESELSAAELETLRRKLEAQRQAVESVLQRLPTATIDGSIFD